jgi:phage terminase large subunit
MPVQVPHAGWRPRRHQENLWRYLDNDKGRRAVAIWHRRAGKDEICLHHAAMSMMTRKGNYWHCLPEYGQARKAIWTAVNPFTGRRRIDEAFPPALRETVNDHEMFIRMQGSTWQLIGSDRYDATVGAGVAGVVYSEWALANPAAWAYHRPIVEENNGWAAFITTPRGRNHAYDMFNHACRTDGWFAERLTAIDTGTLSADQLDAALTEYQALYGVDVGTAQFQQEYMCDWMAAILGAFYAMEMAAVRNEGRVSDKVVALEGQPVHRAWDLGVGDDTSIWWFQPHGSQLFVLDHYASSGVGLEHYAEVIERKEREHGWAHGDDYVPHDAKIKEWGSGRTRVETMSSIGLRPMLVPHHSLDDGINAVRRTLPLCVFHPRTEEGGLAALEQYRREWDEDKKAFRANAVHDWTSHPADAFRYLSMAWRRQQPRKVKPPPDPRFMGWVIPPPAEPKRARL